MKSVIPHDVWTHSDYDNNVRVCACVCTCRLTPPVRSYVAGLLSHTSRLCAYMYNLITRYTYTHVHTRTRRHGASPPGRRAAEWRGGRSAARSRHCRHVNVLRDHPGILRDILLGRVFIFIPYIFFTPPRFRTSSFSRFYPSPSGRRVVVVAVAVPPGSRSRRRRDKLQVGPSVLLVSVGFAELDVILIDRNTYSATTDPVPRNTAVAVLSAHVSVFPAIR